MSVRNAGSRSPISFGMLLRHHCIATDLTQEELAERAGISVGRVGDLERGVRQLPRRCPGAILTQASGLSAQEQAAFVEAARRVTAGTMPRAAWEGLSLARSMPYPFAQARLLHVSAQMRAQKQEPVPARERLEAALAISRRLGAGRDAEHVEQELRELERPAPIHATGA